MKTMTIKFFHKHAERTVKAFLIFLSVTTLTCCEKPASLENEDYFLKTEITDVGKGCFTVNFDCGEDVATIKYAIGYAVDMYKDSISFKENKLADIIEITPENGKVSVPFDFTEPFDFGPFTIYARSVTASGNESPVIKTQVCALPAGLTIEYLSRARLDMRTSYHGNETVVFINSVHQQTIDEDYGGDIDNYIGIIKEIVVRNGYCDYQSGKSEAIIFFRCFAQDTHRLSADRTENIPLSGTYKCCRSSSCNRWRCDGQRLSSNKTAWFRSCEQTLFPNP